VLASTLALLDAALEARAGLLDPQHASAARLFNGLVEGLPALIVDVYGKTLVVHDLAEAEGGDAPLARAVTDHYARRLPWLGCAVWKVRHATSLPARNGTFVLGGASQLTRKVIEGGVKYAVGLTLNRDAGFYLDTRPLRAWARAALAGKRVLNTFAYTGSLGVAARSAGADVLHTDLNRSWLNVAKDSYALNGWPVRQRDFRAGDFFDVVGQLKRDDHLFDTVFLDPPFFSVTEQGRVDLQANALQLINRVRPLIADGGALAFVNNAAFVSGAALMATLNALTAGGYVALEQTLPVPEDSAGYPSTRVGPPAVDPAPFNHSTKMVILRIQRKDGRKASAPKAPGPR
jgi:23S rRNA (cytosine1962-C5)-methyltransferase